MKTHLKLEAYTLAQKSRIMRKYERSLKGGHPLRDNLNLERTAFVRSEARSVHLAYCFLRGRSYTQVEQNSRTRPDWDRVEKLVARHGDRYYANRNITAVEDFNANFRPEPALEAARIRARSQEKKVRVRPSNKAGMA